MEEIISIFISLWCYEMLFGKWDLYSFFFLPKVRSLMPVSVLYLVLPFSLWHALLLHTEDRARQHCKKQWIILALLYLKALDALDYSPKFKGARLSYLKISAASQEHTVWYSWSIISTEKRLHLLKIIKMMLSIKWWSAEGWSPLRKV